MEMVIENRRSIVDKANRAFGFGDYDPSQFVKREDYKTEAEYLTARADFDSRYTADPNFRATVRKVLQEREEEAKRKETEKNNERFKQIRKHVLLDEFERAHMDKEAVKMAQDDYASGKISSAQIGRKAHEYFNELEASALDKKAGHILMNELFRDQRDEGKFTDDDLESKEDD